MSTKPDRAALEAAHCWFPTVDRVGAQPDVTAFKQRARFHQACWRERQKMPMGFHVPPRGTEAVPNGSRIDLAYASEPGANFLSGTIRAAVKSRIAMPQRHQTLDETRLRSDLLSSMPMCFNLFGELHDNPGRMSSAIAAIWPDLLQGNAAQVHFEWSPGRQELEYTGDRTAFDAAIMFADRSTVIGIETKYHEHIKAEKRPHETERLPRYRDITEESGAFKKGWETAILGTELQQIWRDHLLLLAMLQHKKTPYSKGRYVLVHPAGNPSFALAAARYRDLLRDNDSTFEVRTIEELLDRHVLHPAAVEQDFRERYLWQD